jgi:hypothetical protein
MRSDAICTRIVVCLGVLGLLVTGCYHYRTEAPGVAGIPGTDYEGEVVWSLAWGLVQENPQPPACNNQPLSEVRVTSNFAFSLLTILSLGFASPAQVEWKCAKPRPGTGTLSAIPEASLSGGNHAKRD